VHLGTHVPNARAHVSKAPHVRAIMRLKDVKQCSQYLQGVQTCIYSAATIRLQCALWTTHLAPLQCQVTQQHDVTLLTEFNVSSDKTRRAHTVEDIICYS
jgi:hypothetical protein